MFWKALTTMMCLAIAAVVWSWYDLFHAVVGLPVFLVCLLLWKVLRERFADTEQNLAMEVEKDEAGVVHGVCMGLLTGAVAVGMLAGAFRLAEAVGMRDLVEGPSCGAVIQEIAILRQEKLYAGVVRRLDGALQQRWGAACQYALRTAHVEALLGQAEQLPDAERLTHLEHTWRVVSTVEDTRLRQLVQSRLEIQRLREQNARLTADLKALGIPVEHTADGIKLTLTDNVLRFASGIVLP